MDAASQPATGQPEGHIRYHHADILAVAAAESEVLLEPELKPTSWIPNEDAHKTSSLNSRHHNHHHLFGPTRMAKVAPNIYNIQCIRVQLKHES